MAMTFHATDFDGADGGEQINGALAAADAATDAGRRARVVVGPEGPDAAGAWSLSCPLRVPSDVTLVLEDCCLRLADGGNCAMIENSDRETGNRNISVVGVGRPHLDGNPARQARTRRGRLVEIWMEERGLPLGRATREVIGDLSVAEFEAQRAQPGAEVQAGRHLRLSEMGACGIDFKRVEGLRIENLVVGPTNLFGIHAECCNDVVIERICFAQDGSEPNQDGIGIMGPAERVRISGITGTCGDDVIGLHAIHPGAGGPIVGVTISDVVIRNRWNSGLLRTQGCRSAPVRNVVASNLVMLDGEGYSEGHAVIKLGTSWHGEAWDACVAEYERRAGTDTSRDPLSGSPDGSQAAISITGLSVGGWVGPVIAAFDPVDGLAVSGVTGTHAGPLFVNFGNTMRGLSLSNVATTMLPVPESEPFVGGMIEFLIAEGRLSRSIRDDERAAIVFDGDGIDGLFLRDIRIALDDAAAAQAQERGARTVGLIDRTGNRASVTSGNGSALFPGFAAQHDIDHGEG